MAATATTAGCYSLVLATPLTLSEVRSMLPAGIRADSLPRAVLVAFQQHLPEAVTAIQLFHGGCACDLVRDREPAQRDDERPIRQRLAEGGRSRDEIIGVLETHRRARAERPRPPGYWLEAVGAFVAEHARNAGPTLYYLHFGDAALPLAPLAHQPTVILPLERVRQTPESWLTEDTPTIVVR